MKVSLIRVENLYKYYNRGRIKALDGLSFEIKDKNIVGLIGPNGAGKTTLIKLLLGAIKPTSGAISIDCNKIGYVSEKVALPLNESAYDYLLMIAVLSNIKTKDARPKILNHLEQFGLSEFALVSMKKFSSGMKKKMQIIAALLSDPTILLLDEPTTFLDPKTRYEILEFIKTISVKNHMTVVLCSHNLFELEKIVDYILMIKDGKLVVQSSYLEMIEKMNNKKILLIKSSASVMMKSYFEQLSNCHVVSTDPLLITSNDMTYLKTKVIEYAYLNQIIIDEIIEQKDSLYELFNYFNQD